MRYLRKRNSLAYLIFVLGFVLSRVAGQYHSWFAPVWSGLFLVYLLFPTAKRICLVGKKKWAWQRKKKIYLASDIRKIDGMRGTDFEEYLKAHFESLGYTVHLTPTTNDYGADLVLKKGREKTVVQAKRYRDKVGKSAIQEVIGAKSYYKASRAMAVTNSYFTSGAVKLAQATDVELWDRETLTKKFLHD